MPYLMKYPITVFTRGQVQKAVGRTRSTISKRVRNGTFPQPISIDGKTVWLASEIEAWIARNFHMNDPQKFSVFADRKGINLYASVMLSNEEQ